MAVYKLAKVSNPVRPLTPQLAHRVAVVNAMLKEEHLGDTECLVYFKGVGSYRFKLSHAGIRLLRSKKYRVDVITDESSFSFSLDNINTWEDKIVSVTQRVEL